MSKKKLTDSNPYIIMYSCLMVVIVAFLLAFVSSTLKPVQDVNVALDKKKQILAALNIRDLSNEESTAKYNEVVLADNIINPDGTITNGTQGGEKTGFLLNSAAYKEGRLAIYECNVKGETKYVIPVYGQGLWGPIWGYIAVNADCNSIYGAYFNHEGETAGLGAEIKDDRTWQDRFQNKTLYTADGSPAIKVVKKSEGHPESEVDGITGATLTSVGVSNMLQEGFSKYADYLKSRKASAK